MAASNDVVGVILGDLVRLPSELGVTHVVHQLNCLTTRGAGLSQSVAETWSWADVYGRRAKMSRRPNVATTATQATPGTIVIDTPPTGVEAPKCVGFFAQWDYGRPSNHRGGRPSVNPAYCRVKEGDSARNRIVWFQKCLDALAEELKDVDRPKVAFPHEIGCGLARGNWDVYRQKIADWSVQHQIVTVIVRWIGKIKKRKIKKRKRTKANTPVSTNKRSKPIAAYLARQAPAWAKR